MTAPRHLLAGLSAVALCAILAPDANAIPLINFGESGGGNLLSAINNGTGTTNLTITNAPVSVTNFDAAAPATPFSAFLNFNATNTDAAVNAAGTLVQHYSDSFKITSAINGGGTNFLSGTVIDTLTGTIGGHSLNLGVSTPPDSALVFTSDLIAAADLGSPRAFSLAFTNLTNTVAISGAPGSLASTTGQVSGNASGNITTTTVPEPTSLALLGSALLGIGLARRRRKAA